MKGGSATQKPQNVSDEVLKEGERLDEFMFVLETQKKVFTSFCNHVNGPSMEALAVKDQKLFEEIMKLFEEFKTDTRSFSCTMRNKLQVILQLYDTGAENSKIQAEIQNLNDIVKTDYNVVLYEKKANTIKVKCECLLERMKQKKSTYKVRNLKDLIICIIATLFAVIGLLVIVAAVVVFCIGAGVVISLTAPAILIGGVVLSVAALVSAISLRSYSKLKKRRKEIKEIMKALETLRERTSNVRNSMQELDIGNFTDEERTYIFEKSRKLLQECEIVIDLTERKKR